MGIPGDYDSSGVQEAFDRVSAAARQVSIDGRLLSVGFGGLQQAPRQHRQHSC